MLNTPPPASADDTTLNSPVYNSPPRPSAPTKKGRKSPGQNVAAFPRESYRTPQNNTLPVFPETGESFQTPHGPPKRKTYDESSPTKALSFGSERRGPVRARIVDSPPQPVARNHRGKKTSMSTKRQLNEYNFEDKDDAAVPVETEEQRKRKRQERFQKQQSAKQQWLSNLQKFTKGGASIINANGKTVYGLIDKHGNERIYKYKKSFEKAVMRQNGGISFLQDLQDQFNSAFRITPTPTPKNVKPPARQYPVSAPASPIPPAPITQYTAKHMASALPTPPVRAPKRKPRCPDRLPCKTPVGDRTNVPSVTPPAPKTPSKHYKLNKKGFPELIYEHYIPNTKRKRFLLNRTHPSKVFDQLLDKSADRFVKDIIGFPGKTLDRSTGRFSIV